MIYIYMYIYISYNINIILAAVVFELVSVAGDKNMCGLVFSQTSGLSENGVHPSRWPLTLW